MRPRKVLPSAIDRVQVELVHLDGEYGYGYDDDTGQQRWDRWVRSVPEGKLVAPVSGGKFHFDVTPNETDAGYIVLGDAIVVTEDGAEVLCKTPRQLFEIAA